MAEIKGTVGKALASGAAAGALTFLWFGGREFNLSTIGMKANAAVVVGGASVLGNVAGDTVSAFLGGWIPSYGEAIQRSAPVITAVGSLAILSPTIVVKPLQVIQVAGIVWGADMVSDWLLSSMPSLNTDSIMPSSNQ